jgi:hypothetical protein
MRKAWLLLLVVALTAVSVSAFADGAWTAWNQGNFYPYISFNSNPGIAGWGPNYDANGGIDQEWTFAYAGKNYGFNMTTEFGNTPGAVAGSASQAFGGISWFGTWFKLFDMVKVTLGMPRIGDYQQFTNIEGANFARFGDSDWGAYVQVTPIENLSIGLVDYVPGISATSAPGASPVLFGNGFGAAVMYTLPNVVVLQAQYKAISTAAGDKKAAQAGFNLTAMKGLGVNGAVNLDFSSAAQLAIGVLLSAKLAMDPITVALDARLSSAAAFHYGVEAQLEYAMGMWSLGAQIGYDEGVGLFNGNVGDWGGFELYPYVKAGFDNGSSLKIGFLYASGMGTAGGFATWNGVTTAQKSVIAVPIVYVWAF